MQTCPSFSEAFQANMAALRMPIPTTLFATLQSSIASVTSMMTILKTLGANATVAELAVATTKLEKLGIAGSMLASAYLGAVIGSLIVATDAVESCGKGGSASVAITQWAAGKGLFIHPFVMMQLLRHPEVLAPGPYSNYEQKTRVALRGSR
jgi:hypothetical protein